MSDARKPVSSMYCDSVLSMPVDFDWSEGYGERWDTILPDTDSMTLEECMAWLNSAGYDAPDPNPWKMGRAGIIEQLESACIECRDDESDEELREALIANIDDETIDGIADWREAVMDAMQSDEKYHPMMSYYYPLPGYRGDASADQLELDLKGGAVCLASVGDETVLALTGGGMDLSWDICEAYMILGYLPPLHYCDLPRFAGMESNERNDWILEGCLRSCEVATEWAESKRKRLEDIRKDLSRAKAERFASFVDKILHEGETPE